MRPYRIPELARKYVEYDMITTHTELPPMADARVHLLYTFLCDSGALTESAAENIALAVYLVQLGLDTHDLIDAEPVRKEEKLMRSRQLNVLAGDFFSSLFYELLAKAERIDLISVISAAVCEVNRKKVNLYTKISAGITADEFFNAKVELNKELFLPVGDLLDEAVQLTWNQLLHEFSRCEAAMTLLDKQSAGNVFFDEYLHLYVREHGSLEDQAILIQDGHSNEVKTRLVSRYGVIERISEELEQSVTRVQQIVQDVQKETLREETTDMLEPYLATLKLLKPAL